MIINQQVWYVGDWELEPMPAAIIKITPCYITAHIVRGFHAYGRRFTLSEAHVRLCETKKQAWDQIIAWKNDAVERSVRQLAADRQILEAVMKSAKEDECSTPCDTASANSAENTRTSSSTTP